MHKSVKNYIQLLFSNFGRILIGILSTALLARLLGPKGMGVWAIYVGTATFFHALLINWTQELTVKYGIEEWKRKQSLRDTWNYRLPLLLFGFAISFLALLSISAAGQLEDVLQLKSSWWIIIWLYIVNLWLIAEVTSLLVASDNLSGLATAQLVMPLVHVLYMAVIYWGDFFEDNTEPVIFGVTVISCLSWGALFIRTTRRVKLSAGPFSRTDTHRFLKYAWPFIPVVMIHYLSYWCDHYIILAYFTMREVGLFQAAYGVMIVTAGFAAPLFMIILTRMTGESEGDLALTNTKLLKIVPTVISIWGLSIICIISIMPFLFILIMGQEFIEALSLFNILLISIPGAGIFSIYDALFRIQGRVKVVVRVFGLIASSNIAISLALMPHFGPAGAAVGTLSSFILGQILYIANQHTYQNIKDTKIWGIYGGLVIAALIMALVGNGLFARLATGLALLLALILYMRKVRAVDPVTVNKLFSGHLAGMGRYVTKVLADTRA
ncbi:MAG: lipopolysaccharide biosynthesis protein [Nitrospinota bacterium]|nr:lipopolysaccharide biosynthesis protein [Nitrospinota bacterium]